MPDIVTLSDTGVRTARRIASGLPNSRIYVHGSVADREGASVFHRTVWLIGKIFARTDGIVFIGPCGIIVRAIAPHVKDKHKDPPVVVTDVLGRYTVSLLSGHEGGANVLAVAVSNILGGEPVITTTTEAVKDIIVGVGCRRGCASGDIVEAIGAGLSEAGLKAKDIRLLASADIKANEQGLLQAAMVMGLAVRFIPSEEIRACVKGFTPSPVAMEKVNLPAVAEPAALLAGRRTRLILPKKIVNGVTVAIARENSL